MKQNSYARTIVTIAVFTVVSVVGGFLKFNPGTGSIALDSFPGFFVAGFFGIWPGAAVGLLGHLLSAATAGFPLHVLHIPIAIMQGLWSLVFGLIIRRINKPWAILVAAAVAVLLNGVAAPLLLTLIKPDMSDLFRSLIPILSLISAVNVAVASALVWMMSRSQSSRI